MATIDSGTDPLGIIPPGTSTQALVDPTRGASRHSLSPLDWKQAGGVYGHFRAAQKSGATASIAAGGILAGFRWAPVGATSAIAIVTRVRVGCVVTSAVTTATAIDAQLKRALAFTVDFSAGNTQLDLSGTSMSRLRTTMGSTLLATKGPQIATTTVMSGQTATIDTNPLSIANMPLLGAVNATGTAVALPAGAGSPMQDLFVSKPGEESPIILANNEGLVVETITAGPTTGGVAYYVEWTWAEALNY